MSSTICLTKITDIVATIFCERWETEDRYYEIRLDIDLFNAWMLTRHWGGLKTPRKGGGVMTSAHATEDDAKKRYREIIQRRKAHGYALKKKLYGQEQQVV